MGNMNMLQVEIAEALGVSPSQLLTQLNNDVAHKEWLEHRVIHSTSPSVNCHFCVQDAEWPEEDMEVVNENN